jgi:hypothetical protein
MAFDSDKALANARMMTIVPNFNEKR